MLVEHSVDAMAHHLKVAITNDDWPRAHSYIERLKSIILEGVSRSDPLAIQSAGAALETLGQFLELSKRVRMKLDASAVAWQLRADAGTAMLAQRIKPVLPAEDEEAGDVSKLLLQTLRESSEPLTNKELAQRTSKDPATVSRTLKRLKLSRKISQWRAGPKVYNRARSMWDQLDFEAENARLLEIGRAMSSFSSSMVANENPIKDEQTTDEMFNHWSDAKDTNQQPLAVAAS